MMIIPLTKKISMLKAPNRSKYPYCNCLYINDGRRALIDNSCGKENLEFLLGQHLDVVINSHFHEDHIVNNPCFPKAEIWAHRLDAPAIRSLEVFQEYYGFSDLEQKKMSLGFIDAIGLQESKVHREYEDGDIFDFGTVRFRVVLTAGHTPGHCCFYEEKEGLLFSADIDLSEFGPWYGHDCSNLDDFIASIKKCMEIKPGMVVTSHNGIIQDDIPASFQKYLEIIFRKEEIVRNCLQRPSTLEELAEKQIYYGDRISLDDPFFKLSEKMAIHQHLIRLLKMNEIYKSGDIYYLR